MPSPTIQEQLVTQLSGVGVVFPFIGGQSQAGDYVTYHRISSTVSNVMGNNGPGDIQQARFQIDAYSDTYSGAVVLAASITTAMIAWSIQNIKLSEQDLYESVRKKFCVSMDFSVWYH